MFRAVWQQIKQDPITVACGGNGQWPKRRVACFACCSWRSAFPVWPFGAGTVPHRWKQLRASDELDAGKSSR